MTGSIQTYIAFRQEGVKKMERIRITVEISENDKQKIGEAIRQQYPKLKNISDVVRAALREFLKTNVQN